MEDFVLESSDHQMETPALEDPASPGAAPANRESLDRSARLQRLRERLDALSRSLDESQAQRILALSTAELGGDSTEPEFSAVFAEMEREVSVCRLASAALAEGRLEECREHCDGILRNKPHHHLFLGLRVQANAAERSQSPAVVARIRALFDSGPLADAQVACKQALASSPDSAELCELDLDIREKAIHIRNLVDRGEASLQIFDVEGAGESFLRAFHLLPFDSTLSANLALILHRFARVAVTKNLRAAEAALDLARTIHPDTTVDAELTAALEKAKSSEASGLPEDTEPVPSAASASLEPEIIAAPSRMRPTPDFIPDPDEPDTILDIRGPVSRATWLKRGAVLLALAATLFVIVRITQPLLFPGPDHVLEIPDVASGTLTVRSNVAGAEIFINERKYNLPAGSLTAAISLVPDVYQVRITRPGYADFGPVPEFVKAGSNTVIQPDLRQKSAALEVWQAAPGTKVSIDGRLLGTVPKDGLFVSPIEPGARSVQLTRDGFLPRIMARTFSPGEAVTISGRDAELESSDASTISVKRQPEPAKQQPSGTMAALKQFVSTLPPSLRANISTLEEKQVAEPPKAAPPVISTVEKAPEPLPLPAAVPAPVLVASLERRDPAADLQRTEQNAWLAVHLDDKVSIENYQAKFPTGKHEEDARKALANLAAVESTRADAVAVLGVLQRFANAWNTKDVKSITAIQRDLDQRALKAQLAPVKALAMKISPVMPPQINGEQATVVCRRQADETFSDGSARQNPASIVTYVLAKRAGVWGIEHAR